MLPGQNIAWTRRFDRSYMRYYSDFVSAVDAAGDVFVAGRTNGKFPGYTNWVRWFAVFVQKYDTNGHEAWTREFGTLGQDYATSVAVDATGVYVAGWTTGTLPGQTALGNADAFVRKYDLNGNELWTRQFGTSSPDAAHGLSVGASAVYVTGYTLGALPNQTHIGAGKDGFVRKFDRTGKELWTRQFGSAGSTWPAGISADASGVYIAGWNYGAFAGQRLLGSTDVFVQKYDANGTAAWTRQFGTSTQDIAYGVSAGSSGVYVVGTTIGAFSGQTNSGGEDTFVRKYDPNGTAVWTRQFGASRVTEPRGVSVGASGVYVAGMTWDTLPGQTRVGIVSYYWDAFVRQYDAKGNEVWTRQFGTTERDWAAGVSVDSSGVYVAGNTNGVFAGQTATGSPPFDWDGFIRKYSLTGTEVWTRQIGTIAFEDRPDKTNQAVDAAGNVYVAGIMARQDLTNRGYMDVFLRKYDASGNELWTRRFGSQTEDFGGAVAVDVSGVYIAGYTYGTLPGQKSLGTLSDRDAFVRKYDANGTELWTRQFGTSGHDEAHGLSVGASGVYVTGGTFGTFPGQTGSGNRSYADAFVRKYRADGTEMWTRQFGAANGNNVSVSVDVTGVYVAGLIIGALPGQTRPGGGWDAFVRKYDVNGSEMWTRQFGTSSFELARGVSVGASGVYVVGFTSGTFAGQTNAGGMDAFVRKYDPSGKELWTRQFGTLGKDVAYAVSSDASGVYVAGSTGGILPGQSTLGLEDAFVRKYGPNGNELWTRQFGTAQVDLATGVAVDGSDVYVVGTSGPAAIDPRDGRWTVFVVKIAQNVPPVANIAVTQLTAVGSNAAISLDATGSSDADDAFADLSFKWTVDNVVVCEGTAAQCATYVVRLPIDIALGSHQVTLRVSDPDGAFDETSTTVVVHPAQLSVLQIEEAEVEFDPSEREVEVSGEIGLPFGTTFSELLPRIRTTLVVAGKAVVPADDVSFAVKGGEKKEWKFENKAATTGITKFQVDWKGSRYRFHAKDFPVRLKSKLITTTETIVQVELDPKKIASAFTLSVGTVGAVTFDANGAVTSSTVPYRAKGKKVTLTLAGPLQATTVIRFTGGLSRVVNVGADLKASVGRFHLHARFSGATFAQGVHTTPRTLDFRAQVGRQGYSGSTSLGPTRLGVEGSEWEFEEDDG